MHRPPIETHPDNILCFRVANDIEVCVYAFVERDSVIGHVLDRIAIMEVDDAGNVSARQVIRVVHL